MKRVLGSILLVIFLLGCSKQDKSVDNALVIRQQIANSSELSFNCIITADYLNYAYEFKLHCKQKAEDVLEFTVVEPDSIEGINGEFSSKDGKIMFDEKYLTFPLLADDVLSPIATPWIFIHALKGGYIHSAGNDNGFTRVTIDDTFDSTNFQIDIWLDENNIPTSGQIIWDGQKILSFIVTDFTCV